MTADATDCIYMPRNDSVMKTVGWLGIPKFHDDDFPLILFGDDKVFVAARRAKDGSRIK